MATVLGGILIFTAESQTQGNPAKGKAIFDHKCSLCHGKSGGGLGPSSRMPNFSDKKYQESHSAKDLFDKITQGMPGTGMPSWERTLSPEERWNVVSYIRTLAK